MNCTWYRFFSPLFMLVLSLFVIAGCDKKNDPSEPLPGEPIKVVKPTEIISSADAGDEVDIELQLLLPNPIDSLTATYLLNDASVLDVQGQDFDGSSVHSDFTGTVEIPDSVAQGSFVRGNFVAKDVVGSTYLKSIKININN